MRLAFAIPAPAETGSGGGTDYIYGIASALRTLGHEVEIVCGTDPAFPPGAVPIIDGMLLPRLRPRLNELVSEDAIVVVHHVSAAAGRKEGMRGRVREIEREMLPRFRRVIATSHAVAERLAGEFGISARPVPPGLGDLPRTRPADDPVTVLAVGVLTRRKGHDKLLRTFARLTDLPWRLVIAGDAGRDPTHAAELSASIEELGLARRATLLPNPAPPVLDREWRTASVFALATRWEGYPAAVAEALRRGIPVVVSDGSGAGAIVPDEAGVICSTDDMATFGKCLRRLLCDTELRADMAQAAWQAGQELPSWNERANEFAAMLRS